MSDVRSYLDISTGNLTHEEWLAMEAWRASGHSDVPIIVAPHDYGAWVWVITDDVNLIALGKEAPNLAAIMQKARELGCEWINFDQDAELDNDLPSFVW